MAEPRTITIVLVHGAFAESLWTWKPVVGSLLAKGYKVVAAPNPLRGVSSDAAYVSSILKTIDGPIILVGHSYGGAVITEAGNDPKVTSLAYIAAFAPDASESLEMLLANPAPGEPVPPILPPQDGFLRLDSAKFADSFAADVDPGLARFMADSQVPWGVGALSTKITVPAWKSKPTYYLVASDDRMIPPRAQREMAKRAGAQVVEAAGSHAIYVSRPDEVARLITQAALAPVE
jgi:pimeloyl-ACP methyl ester carboxylesterase